ncbi:MAG: hypothetical protein ABI741_07475 [Ferruginibacter sp.]
MNQYQEREYSKQVYYRLIALWVICEAFAGGIMHAAKLPFTGLVVSSLAITCIILIAYYVPTKGAILKATLIVAIFKLMLSPHSPPTAYIAVFFQGLMGQLLLMNRRYFKVSSVLLAVLSLFESAIQRILVLLLFSGTDLWKAVNQFIQKTTGEKDLTDYSLGLAIGYVILHALIGIFVGIAAVRLATLSAGWKNETPSLLIDNAFSGTAIVTKRNNRKRKLKPAFVIILLALLALYIQSYIDPKYAVIQSHIILNILLRSILILLVWYLVAGPLIMFALKRSLRLQQQKYKQEINEVMLLLPQIRYIFKRSFKLSESRKGLARIKLFLKTLLVNVLAD